MDVKHLFSLVGSSLWLPLTIGLLGLGALGYGFLGMTSQDEPDIIIEKKTNEAEPADEESERIFIDVEGAVKAPGVYELSSESRVQDAITAAGGMHKDVDRFAVAKNMNMAAKISDGMKIYIPFEGETPLMTSIQEGSGEVAGIQTGMINVNTASQSTLEELSGVGPVTAKKIIDNRPYETVNELLTKKVVGQSVFEKIKDQVSTN